MNSLHTLALTVLYILLVAVAVILSGIVILIIVGFVIGIKNYIKKRQFETACKNTESVELSGNDDIESIGDCHRCWCDTCNRIDLCTQCRNGITQNSIIPNPCNGCHTGMRFMPVENEPACGNYLRAVERNHG